MIPNKNTISGMISVIVPIFNREKTIQRCIDSILASTYHNLELLLIDDGSTDNSWNIIQSYTDSRIISIHTSNRGVCAARNTGLEKASGEYISFVDSDDFITTDIYSCCMDISYQYHPDIIMFNHGVYFEESKQKYDSPPIALPQNKLLNRDYILSPIISVLANLDSRKEYFIENFTVNKLYKRSILVNHQIRFDESRRRWEDKIFQLYFLKYTYSFYYFSKNGYYYSLGNSSFSQKYDPSVFQYILSASQDYKNIIGDIVTSPSLFDSDYTNDFYCRSLNNTIIYQFSLPNLDETRLKIDLKNIFLSPRAQELFSRFHAETPFEEQIKDRIMQKEINNIYLAYKNEYVTRREVESKKVQLNHSIARRIFRRIRSFFHF